MPTNEPKLLKLALQYHNKEIEAGRNPEIIDSRNLVLENLHSLAPEEIALDQARIAKRVAQRKIHDEKVRRSNIKRWWLALRHLGKLVSAADIQNDDLTESTFQKVATERLVLNIPDTVGGPKLKCLLLLSLHSRACAIGAEIEALLTIGNAEAATGRARTLYEIAIIATLISNDGIKGTYELSERYYVTALLEEKSYHRAAQKAAHNAGQREHFSAKHLLEETDGQLLDAANREWGPRFREQYDWARPAISNHQKLRRITFADLERACDAEWMRISYLEMNHAIHAGPSTTIYRTKFRGAKLNPTGPTVEPRETSRAGHMASFLLLLICDMIGHGVCRETECWDDDLIIASIRQHADAAIVAFQRLQDNETPNVHDHR
ncbi:DUF5677 domain-containing protein [Actinomadura terrae]|uniref:DUF5677 domain-containing protein n=1 Tax=Actinomadura terrae TaxID=604353 RepID=UPI001FA7ABED|nr:DUF5677 domain-containing protein [Actinomadura terrae]